MKTGGVQVRKWEARTDWRNKIKIEETFVTRRYLNILNLCNINNNNNNNNNNDNNNYNNNNNNDNIEGKVRNTRKESNNGINSGQRKQVGEEN